MKRSRSSLGLVGIAVLPLLVAALATFGCTASVSGGGKEGSGSAGYTCDRLPAAEVEAVVGKLRWPPKEKSNDTFGTFCYYEFGEQYVDVSGPPAKEFEVIASRPHAPLSSLHDTAFLRTQVSLTVDGVGDAAYLVNLNGLEFALWAKKGAKVVAIQSTLGPGSHLDAYEKLATAALAH